MPKTTKTVTTHICDLCSKENNLGDKYESGESEIKFKGTIGSSYSSGGYSWDEEKVFCLQCTKKLKRIFESDFLKKLEHHKDTTVGLYAIDKSPSEVSKEWIEKNAFQLDFIE